ncbi:MAG: hypothetical protein WAT91_10255 [Saprospiraceae bacterium]
MRRSLLLINPLLFGLILSIGQCSKSGTNGVESNSSDSLSRVQMSMAKDSIAASSDTSIIHHVGKDSTGSVRIEHGSDNPAKLDSIKKAKGKKKN